jgi:hypothetical protein
VRYGRTVEPGALPVYSVDTEEEAEALLTLTCPTNVDDEFIATELVVDQTLENLYAFGARLEAAHEWMKARNNETDT